MDSWLIPALLGVVCMVLGAANMKGRINSIHWYHRHRVTEENRLAFGKLVGLGTIIIGACVIAFAGLSWAAEATGAEGLTLAGTVITVAGLAVGLGLSVYAMIKYNKGIF